MRSMGALVVAVAAVLVCCRADGRQESDSTSHGTHERFEGHEATAGGGGLVRHARDTRVPAYLPYLMARQFDYSPYAGKRDVWPYAPVEFASGYYGLGLPKRNFDEIDRSGLDNFVKKRNFDEIDLSSMPFPYSKRVPHSGNFDEIDLSSMPFPYTKRTAHALAPNMLEQLNSLNQLSRRFDVVSGYPRDAPRYA